MTHNWAHEAHVQLAQSDRSTFLALVSVLHRRGVEVVAAELRPGNAGLAFTVTFLATPVQARTVLASLRNLIDVMDAKLLHEAEFVEPAQLLGAAG
jgi:hypothetical protein